MSYGLAPRKTLLIHGTALSVLDFSDDEIEGRVEAIPDERPARASSAPPAPPAVRAPAAPASHAAERRSATRRVR